MCKSTHTGHSVRVWGMSPTQNGFPDIYLTNEKNKPKESHDGLSQTTVPGPQREKTIPNRDP